MCHINAVLLQVKALGLQMLPDSHLLLQARNRQAVNCFLINY